MGALRTVPREEFDRAVAALEKDYRLIGPRAAPGKGFFYEPLPPGEKVRLGPEFTVESVKKYFLEPDECLYKYRRSKDGVSMEETPLPTESRIIFGVRPCEARGLTLLDKVFDADLKDRSYLHHRQRTVLVGLACREPAASCFCTSLGGSPAESRGMDALIFVRGEGEPLLIETVTEKGAKVFGTFGAAASAQDEKALAAERKRLSEAVRMVVDVPKHLDAVFDSPYWDKASAACISCGVCTYLCPTCHCFDLVDEDRKRLRCYDGCSFRDFTQETSGENPRPTKKERYRQRVYHKFSFFKKNFGENLCVGCGRCVRHCPMGLNIARIAEGAPKDMKG